MSQRIVCLVAGQRCGTNALRNIVTNTDKFANLGEIFNTATLDWPGNFFSYCCQRNVRIGDISRRSVKLRGKSTSSST